MRMLAAAVLALLVGLAACGGPSDSEKDRAVRAAEAAYAKAKRAGTNFDSGPCIAERLPGLPDWVADIAHDPRRDVDDDPANQCSRYRDGDASNFVELDPAGRLIRTG